MVHDYARGALTLIFAFFGLFVVVAFVIAVITDWKFYFIVFSLAALIVLAIT